MVGGQSGVEVVDRVLSGPLGFIAAVLLATVAGLVLSSYLYPERWAGLRGRRLRERLDLGARLVLRSALQWMLPFGIGIVVTFSVAIWLGERFDRLPYPVAVLIGLYVTTSLLAMWLIRRRFPRFGWTSEPGEAGETPRH
jgi:hypothetical protein